MSNAANKTPDTTATRAAALVSKASTSCIAITALAAAIEDQFSDCPVQMAIAAALLALADAHTAAEEATR
jgi:hypothetical protein